MLRTVVAGLVLGLLPTSGAGGLPTEPGRPLPLPLRGVTTESVSPLRGLVRAVARHQEAPTVRVVFQPGEPPSSYARAVTRLRHHAYLMGQPFDSTATRAASVAEYRARVAAYVDRFGSRVDLWEIGNELNGEWVGKPRDIDRKVAAAYDVVERQHRSEQLRSAITLNYWPSHDCYAHRWEQTLRFARQLPGRVKRGVDVVLLSFYETACVPRAHPTDQQFIAVFTALKRIFPSAQVGMGEVGAQGRADGLPANPTLAEKKRIASRYYGLHATLRAELGPRYIGGYFWWYYHQDAVLAPPRRSLWPLLDRLLASLDG